MSYPFSQKITARPAWSRTSRVAHCSFQSSRLTIVEGRAIRLRHRRCDGAVGGRGGTAARLASAGSLTATAGVTSASAIDRGAGGVTAGLASSTNQIIRAVFARAKHSTILHMRDAHLLLAATTASPASLDVRVADLLVIFHFGAAFRFATTSCFTTASRFATTLVSNTASRFAATRRITACITTAVVTVTKAEALGTEAERQNDRPENDIPFHRFRLLKLLTVRERPFDNQWDNPRVKRCFPYRVNWTTHNGKIIESRLARIVRLQRHVKNIPLESFGTPGPAENAGQSAHQAACSDREHRFYGLALIVGL